jgi:hypothetical protein
MSADNTTPPTDCYCDAFEFGDMVRSIQNPNLTGQVIGERSWGAEYLVRLADGASTIWWHGIEMEHDGGAYELPDNVVKVDFTKARAVRADTKTEGAA